MKRTLAQILFLGTLLSLSIVICQAQSASTATIIGTVTDPRGAVVPGATIVARNVDTGIERTTQTTTDGLYRFDNLPTRLYDLKGDAPGFWTAQTQAGKLQV